MRKKFAGAGIALFLIWALSGCSAVNEKSANLSAVYAVAAVMSMVLLISCCYTVRQRRFWFILLFSCVFVVNAGYTLLSVSSGLEMALWANRIAYLGSVFLPVSMLMNILNVTDTPYRKRLPAILLGVAMLVFLVAASPGFLDIYYREVSFEIVNGVGVLQKVYGPLHPLYMIYLLGYLATMIVVILRARVKKTINSAMHAVILAAAVLVNIGVWLVEQLVSFDFEMLSVSYIISELFLLGVHLIMRENQKLCEQVKRMETVQRYSSEEKNAPEPMLEKPVLTGEIPTERMELFVAGLEKLTQTEKAIYDAYIVRATTKEVMASLNITENTLKFHNKNIYSKLGVSSRKDLLEIHKHLKVTTLKHEETADNTDALM